MARNVERRGHLGQQGGVAVAGACHQLANMCTARIAGEGSRNRPGLERRLLGRLWHGVEMVENPQRVISLVLGNSGHMCHCLVLLDWITNLVEVLSPALWKKDAESHRHVVRPLASGHASGRALRVGV